MWAYGHACMCAGVTYSSTCWYHCFWMSLKSFGDIPGMFIHYCQIILHFLYVSQSVGWLTSLLKLDKCRDRSCSGWDIFLKFFGDIPGTLVHYFQVILNFFYVCQSASWLTSLLKLDKYRDISSSGWYIFLNFFGDIPLMLVHPFKIILNFCMSVSILVGLLPYWH